MFRSFLVFLLLIPSLAMAEFDYDSAENCANKDDGSFNWYCEKPKPKKERPLPVPEAETKNALESSPLTYREQKLKEFGNLQKELEDLRKIAIMDPSYENLKVYIAFQLKVQEMAGVFTDSWKRVQWQNPELDYSVKHPTASAALRINMLEDNKLKRQNLQTLSEKGWGIWFFYSSTCPYCKMMVEPLNLLSKNGLKVLPITIDGKVLDGLIDESRINQGQAQMVGVKQTPSFYLVNGNTKMITPVATGSVSYTDLLTRIYIIVNKKVGEMYN